MKEGAEVTVLVKPDDPIKIDSIKHLTNKLRIVEGDIRNPESCEEIVRNQEVIYHLAAETQVIFCMQRPRDAFEVNALGTLNILEGIRKFGSSPHLIHASTDKVFGEPKYLPIDEKHPFNPDSPYEVAKLAAERMVNTYHATYGLPTTIVRWSNTIGGRDANYLRIVPSIIWPLFEGKVPVIRGDGSQIRDYMYVEDVVKCVLRITQNRKVVNGEDFNVGTGKPTSVIELARMILRLMGYEKKVEPAVLGQVTKGEISSQYLSSSKIREKLGFTPDTNLESALTNTIEWSRTNQWWLKVVRRVEAYYAKQSEGY